MPVDFNYLQNYARAALLPLALTYTRRHYNRMAYTYRRKTWRYGRIGRMNRYSSRYRRTPFRRKTVTRSRGFKKRKRFSPRVQRAQIGRPVGTSTSRTQLLTISPTGSTSRNFNLETTPLTNIIQAGTVDELMSGRLSNAIYVSGFKICMQVNSIVNATRREPIVFNFAIVSSKRAITPLSANFLRGEGTETGVDLSINRTGLELACMPINTDLYSILLHKRIKLWQVPDANAIPTNTPKASKGPYHWWVPLRRQLTFEDGATTANDNVYIVHWADYVDTPASSPTVANLYDMQARCITYYRNMMAN